MKQLTPVSQLKRSLAPTYRAAAGGVLDWKQETAFLEAQIKRDWKIARAVNNQVPATVESLKLAVRECAAMGLSMSPQAQLVYFIPRRARKMKPNESKAQYESVPFIVTATPSYRGLAYIAMHYAGAAQVAAEVVYQADHFRYLGPVREPDHEPTLDNAKRGERFAIGVYAVVKMTDGTVRCEYIDAPTVLKIRQCSDFPNSMMWTTLWTEGWRKAAIRRICKTVMVTEPRMQAAVETMDHHDTLVERDEPPDPDRGVSGLEQAMIAHDEEPETIEAEPEQPDQPESKHPPGSIEWWLERISHADSLEAMDKIKADALLDGVDRSDDADTFRQSYAARMQALRQEAA